MEGQAKGSSDEEQEEGEIRARRSSHSWHAECNVTRRCPYLFAIISARFHRSGRRGVSWPGRYTKVLCRHLRYRTAGRVHNNTSWNTSRHPTATRRGARNRSCVTASTGGFSPMGSSRTTVRLSSVSSVSPRVFRDFVLTRRAQGLGSPARIYDECEKNLLSRRPVQGPDVVRRAGHASTSGKMHVVSGSDTNRRDMPWQVYPRLAVPFT